jgi:hypothetical protein
MTRADFDTQPNGFPLESDATLGFMQTAYTQAIENLAKIVGDGSIILDGVVVTGGTATDGWIFHGGEVLFFHGGAVSTNFIVDETVVQKNNEDATPVDRYFTRFARFGTGAGQTAFANLKRYRIKDNLDTIGLNSFSPLVRTDKQGEIICVSGSVAGTYVENVTVNLQTWCQVAQLTEPFRPGRDIYGPVLTDFAGNRYKSLIQTTGNILVRKLNVETPGSTVIYLNFTFAQ